MKILRDEHMDKACKILESKGFEVIDSGHAHLFSDVELEAGMGKTIVWDENGNMLGCIAFRKKAGIKEYEAMINLMKLTDGIPNNDF